MRISFAIPLLDKINLDKIAKNLSILGYEGIEPLIKNPEIINIEKIKKIISKYHIKLSGFRTGPIYLEEGISFSDPNLIIRKRSVERIKRVIEISSIFKNKVLIGLIQGRLKKGINVSQTKEWIIKSLRECARFALNLEVEIAIEPVNRYELEYNNTVDEVKEMIRMVNLQNISILIDTFHMNIEEVSIPESIISAKDYIGHVHFADSNRLVPGKGHLNFYEVVKTLKQIKYEGWITLEIQSLENFEIEARNGINYLKNLFEQEVFQK